MGYYTEGKIRNFYPDDTDTKMYIRSDENMSIEELFAVANDHFKEKFDSMDVKISCEHIQTTHLGYDVYDPSDYTDFIVLELDI